MGQLLSEQRLLDAWQHVWTNVEAGSRQASEAREFAVAASSSICRISTGLAAGSWQPEPVRPVVIGKAGAKRRLSISAVADQVVERALATGLDPVIDPELMPCSYGYRRGLGVADAIDALGRARDTGSSAVLRVDVRRCFDSIPKVAVLQALAPIVCDDDLLEVVRLLLYRGERGAADSRELGLHQGSPLSPMLCNLYLDAFDRDMLARNFEVIRYADDIAIPLGEPDQAPTALQHAEECIERLGLRLNQGKQRICAFEDGVPFLGQTITATTKRKGDAMSRPERRSIYVVQQDALLRSKGERIRVESRKVALASAPWRRTSQVVCIGRVGMTTAFMHRALSEGVDVVLLSSSGRFSGRLHSPFNSGSAARHRQHLAADDPQVGLRIARSMVAGKIANMRTSLLRAARRGKTDGVAKTMDELKVSRRDALAADTLARLLGLEGSASRSYFQAWGHSLPDPWPFHGRRRRPPSDPVNSMLSFGYTLLMYEAIAAVQTAGLDPAVGFLHRMKGNRPALALDLMEEFRPVVVDAVVNRITSTGMLSMDDFAFDDVDDSTRCLMTPAGRRVFLEAYERRMLTVSSNAGVGDRMSYRECLAAQARQLAALLTGARQEYQPMAWK